VGSQGVADHQDRAQCDPGRGPRAAGAIDLAHCQVKPDRAGGDEQQSADRQQLTEDDAAARGDELAAQHAGRSEAEGEDGEADSQLRRLARACCHAE
jgi:hypothetical protein